MTHNTPSAPYGHNPTRAWAWGLASPAFFRLATFGHESISNACVAVFNLFGQAAMESGLHRLFAVLPAWASDRLLVSTNIERIPYVQYAPLAILPRRRGGEERRRGGVAGRVPGVRL